MQQQFNHVTAHSDTDIIDAILSGNTASFEILIRRYNPALYKIARSFGFNHQDAEDLMQDAYISAYVALDKFENRSSYKTWICRIMINKCLYKLKYGYYKNEFPCQIQENNDLPMFATSNQNGTEAALLNRELALVLEKSLQNIPAIYRTVFVLREIEGFSIAETAELLEITAINVKVRLNRAKSLLQKQIEYSYSNIEIYSFNLFYCDAIVEKVFMKIKMLHKNE